MHAVKALSGITRIFVGRTSSKHCFHTTAVGNKKVAVVLSGCGVYDGSEVHEASAVLVHLSRAGYKASMFAPRTDQMHVINHLEGKPMEEKRNVLVESARIARGQVDGLENLKEKDFDAIIFPGGFGAAKNLSTFAGEGASMKLNSDVERVLKEFHGAGKPIGACCIAPVLVAKAIPGCQVTVGHEFEEAGQEGRWPYKEAAQAITAMGAKHVSKNVIDIHMDSRNKIITTPAFMCETEIHHIFDGIGKMVYAVAALCK